MVNLIQNIQRLADLLGGKAWQKGGRSRIYVEGGNNHQYQGSWYYELGENGYESKCYLTEGFSNKNREAYVNKQLADMDQSMDDAIRSLEENSTPATPTLPVIEDDTEFEVLTGDVYS